MTLKSLGCFYLHYSTVAVDGFTSILTKSQQKIIVSKSDSSLNALAKIKKVTDVVGFSVYHFFRTFSKIMGIAPSSLHKFDGLATNYFERYILLKYRQSLTLTDVVSV